MLKAIDDFAAIWEHESAKTIQVLGALTDAALETRVTPSGRTLGFLAWHIVTTIPEMLNHGGIPAAGPGQDAPVPSKAEQIRAAYASAAATVVPALRRTWRDTDLAKKVPMYGEEWNGHDVLERFLFHEIHHRAQMTILMRQAHLRVPGIYGPAQEEWAQFGMPTMP